MIELFPDQQEALARVVEAYREQPVGGKALIVAATGWGKTIWFSALIKAIQIGKPVLIIAHHDELLNQAIEKIHMLMPGAIVGKVGGGSHDYGAPITVAGIDTISGKRHLEKLHTYNYGLIVCDECHHGPAPKYKKVFTALPDAFRVGVTATDIRLDGLSLDDLFGPPLFKMNIIDAIKVKRLCMVRAIAIATETTLDNIGLRKNLDGDTDFNQHDLGLAVNTPARNRRVVRAYQEHASGKRAICFGVTVDHAQALSDAFNDVNITSVVVTGTTPPSVRKQIYAAFHDGEIKVICNVGVLTEGFDEKLVECVIMARPTQSWALYIQCVGRGLRVHPDKTECLILDLTDNCKKHKLIPQNLSKAVGVQINNQETLEEALVRAEKREQEAKARKLTEKRVTDFHVNMFEVLEWKELPNGTFVMEVGDAKHRVALIPCKGNVGLYEVWARLAPTFNAQKWSSAQELQYAQILAERYIKALHDDPQSIRLLDKTQSWRKDPIADGQKKKMNWHKIEWRNDMTKGEASDLINAHLAGIAQRRAEREARKAAKTQVYA